MPDALVISVMAELLIAARMPDALVIGVMAELLIAAPMPGSRGRVAYERKGTARDESKDQKPPPPPPRWMKGTKKDCFHGENPTTRSLTRHNQTFPGTQHLPISPSYFKLADRRSLVLNAGAGKSPRIKYRAKVTI